MPNIIFSQVSLVSQCVCVSQCVYLSARVCIKFQNPPSFTAKGMPHFIDFLFFKYLFFPKKNEVRPQFNQSTGLYSEGCASFYRFSFSSTFFFSKNTRRCVHNLISQLSFIAKGMFKVFSRSIFFFKIHAPRSFVCVLKIYTNVFSRSHFYLFFKVHARRSFVCVLELYTNVFSRSNSFFFLRYMPPGGSCVSLSFIAAERVIPGYGGSLPFLYYRMCSLSVECVLFLQNVFSFYRMCSLSIECVSSGICVLFLQNVFSFYRMCSLSIECVSSGICVLFPSIVGEHILQRENTFYSKRTHSIVREHILAIRRFSSPPSSSFCWLISFLFKIILLTAPFFFAAERVIADKTAPFPFLLFFLTAFFGFEIVFKTPYCFCRRKSYLNFKINFKINDNFKINFEIVFNTPYCFCRRKSYLRS